MSQVTTVTSSDHSRGSSASSMSSAGRSYQMILDHILLYTGSDEIPLSATYAWNSSQRSNPLATQDDSQIARPRAVSSPLSNAVISSRPIKPRHASTGLSSQVFQTALFNHCCRLSSQSCSLSPSLMASFLRACFPVSLELVDFPQALDGLNYLKDLGARRRREITFALKRAGVTRDASRNTINQKVLSQSGVVSWRRNVLEREKKVEVLESQLFMSLRRWILINEMSMQPFHKHNALAMLNTLFPPVEPNEPTSPSVKPPQSVLKDQREVYFKFIRKVERKGAGVLEPLLQWGKPTGCADENGWPTVSRTLDLYLRASLLLVDECSEVQGAFDFDSQGLRSNRVTGFRRRMFPVPAGNPVTPEKSSTSFTTPHRNASADNTSKSAGNKYKITPTSAPPAVIWRGSSPGDSKTMGLYATTEREEGFRRPTRLEKIAREIRKIRERRKVETSLQPVDIVKDVDDMDRSSGSGSPATSPSSSFSNESEGKTGLRRLRSLGDLTDGKRKSFMNSTTAKAPPAVQPYNREQMTRSYQAWQANGGLERSLGRRTRAGASFEV